MKIYITILNFVLCIFIISCFEAERDNAYDPKSPDYKGNAGCSGVCPHLWTILTEEDRCFMQGDAFPCGLDNERFITGCFNLCTFGDDSVGPWSEGAIECAYGAHDSASFNQCINDFQHNNSQINFPQYTNSDIYTDPVNYTSFSSTNTGDDFWIHNTSGSDITNITIISSNPNTFTITREINNNSVGSASSESFSVSFNTSVGPGFYSGIITINFYHDINQTNYSFTINVSGNL